MAVEEELAGFSPGKDTVLSIGVFDGVHLGHKFLIALLMEQAGRQNLLGGVVTFRQHPQEVLKPWTGLPFLTGLAERIRLLKDEGVEIVVPLSFDDELAGLSARQFVGLLKKYLRMRGLVIGPDFALGRKREGDADTLRVLGREMGFRVTAVSPAKINGEIVSSTAIRQALAQGDMKKVRDLAGRPFGLHGRVVAGDGRGEELGFPTANLDVEPGQALPADGVYAVRAYIGEKVRPAVAYIGKKPTFGGNKRGVEVYVLDYHNSLRGQDLKVDIMERLRGERRFGAVEELKKQIADDVERGRAILDAGGVNWI